MVKVAEPQSPVLLSRLNLEGFRSIRSDEISFGQINILIGANGAGKSNLIGFFRMLSFMLSADVGLSTFVGLAGGASALLFEGPKNTSKISAALQIDTAAGFNEYSFWLGHTAADTLVFLDERFRFSAASRRGPNRWMEEGAGHFAPRLLSTPSKAGMKTQQTILRLLRKVHVYHFHDTSRSAHIKQHSLTSDDRYLREDAGNLASVLLRLRLQFKLHYKRITETIRIVAPFFDDFVLEPAGDRILLRWRQVDSDVTFGPSQLSDGTLRAMALITLLLQPPEMMPALLILDEPELGLHPSAVRVIAGLIRSASTGRQCIAATQSPQLLDEFSADEIIVTERRDQSSKFRRLDETELERWLEEYSLSDLWDMNVLGGKPGSLAAE